MCIAFYTVNSDSFYSFEEQRAVIVRVFKDDELVETVSFPYIFRSIEGRNFLHFL